MLNTIILIGNLGQDPELLRNQEGRYLAKFSLATSPSTTTDTNDWYEDKAWHKIIIFRESTAIWVRDTLKKGNLVCVEGKLTYKLIKNEQGRPIWIPYIVISNTYGHVEILLPKKTGVQASEKGPDVKNESDGLDAAEQLPLLPSQLNSDPEQPPQQNTGEIL